MGVVLRQFHAQPPSLNPDRRIALRIKTGRTAEDLGCDLVLLERYTWVIERVFGQVSEQSAEGFRRVKAMAFGKSLYLLEALLSTDSETIRYSHITGEVTELPILLQTLDFTYVTVSNLLKPILANSFVLRLLTHRSESFLHLWGNRFLESGGGSP